MRLMQRDKQIVDFLKEVKCSDAESISILFFGGSLRSAQKRLKILSECGYMKKWRKDHWSSYVYYVENNKPKQIEHDIYLSKILSYLKSNDIEVLKYKATTKINNIIVDGLIVLKVNNSIKLYFVEIERSKFKKQTINKYKDISIESLNDLGFTIKPSILLITSHTGDIVSEADIPFNIIKTDLEFQNLLRQLNI